MRPAWVEQHDRDTVDGIRLADFLPAQLLLILTEQNLDAILKAE